MLVEIDDGVFVSAPRVEWVGISSLSTTKDRYVVVRLVDGQEFHVRTIPDPAQKAYRLAESINRSLGESC